MKIDVRINSLIAMYCGSSTAAVPCGRARNTTAISTRSQPGEGNVKAIASANLDDCFAVRNIRVMEGKNGLFVSMPSYKGSMVLLRTANLYAAALTAARVL